MTKRSLIRRPTSHKGDHGHVWIIAGSDRMPGAGRLAVEAALRSGAGRTTWVTTRGAYRVMGRAVPEAMALTFDADRSGGSLPSTALKAIMARLRGQATAVGIGPGLGRTAAVRRLVLEVLRNCAVPVILDADALWAVEGGLECLRRSSAPLILTPHQGELERLFGRSRVSVPISARGRVAKWITNQYDCVLVWKGHRTRVTARGRRSYLNRTGNAGLAKGGSGDVLTGIISALAAQGFEAYDAARIGVHAHGRAADLAARSQGMTALTASDVLRSLPAVWRALEKKKDLRHL